MAFRMLGLGPTPPVDPFYEPPPCYAAFSAAVGENHYLWVGHSSVENILCFNSRSEQWREIETTGTPHPGQYGGPCTFLSGNLYMFGGVDGPSYYNTLSKLNSESLLWSLEASKLNGERPMRKFACGLVAIDDTTLCCVAGFGLGPTQQTGSLFTRDTRFSGRARGWTNECHMFDTREGI